MLAKTIHKMTLPSKIHEAQPNSKKAVALANGNNDMHMWKAESAWVYESLVAAASAYDRIQIWMRS
jgi:hypothetical protein